MQKILILYASQTGMTMDIATILHGRLVEAMPTNQFDLQNVRDIEPQQLTEYPLVVFGGSTWDHGINSPDGEEFLERLVNTKPDLSANQFALFGVGDSAYPEFCAALPLMQADIETCGGHVDKDFFTIDGFANEAIMTDLIAWATQFIEKQSTV